MPKLHRIGGKVQFLPAASSQSRPMPPNLEIDMNTDDIPEELKPLEKQYVGRRVLIVKKDHPHFQSVGTVDRIEKAHALGKWGFVVNYDNGLSGFIFHGSEWRVLD